MTRLAVMADPHCDDFGSKIDAATGLNARWTDTVAMVRWVANDAHERGADALIVAGDLTESRHPAPWRVAQIGAALGAFPGPVVLVRGNHDGTRAGVSIVDVLAAGRPTWSGFSRPGITVVGDVAIAALPYLDRAWLRAQPGFEGAPDADVFRILAEQYRDEGEAEIPVGLEDAAGDRYGLLTDDEAIERHLRVTRIIVVVEPA